MIKWLVETYCDKNKFQLISYHIDNITSTFDTKQEISLHKLANNIKNASYNPERFHALSLKNIILTLVVFQTGKINIIGNKSVESITSLWKFIQKEINVALKNVI